MYCLWIFYTTVTDIYDLKLQEAIKSQRCQDIARQSSSTQFSYRTNYSPSEHDFLSMKCGKKWDDLPVAERA